MNWYDAVSEQGFIGGRHKPLQTHSTFKHHEDGVKRGGFPGSGSLKKPLGHLTERLGGSLISFSFPQF